LPEFESNGAVVIGISADSKKSHESFATKNDLRVILLSDTDRIAIEAYGAWGKKKMYGKEYEGIVRSTYLIDPTGVIRWVWPSVKVAGHAEEVLGTLRKLRNA
jgi:peroxiredoxin Q/BCP